MCSVFTDFWAFIAALILISVTLDGIAKIVRANRGASDED